MGAQVEKVVLGSLELEACIACLVRLFSQFQLRESYSHILFWLQIINSNSGTGSLIVLPYPLMAGLIIFSFRNNGYGLLDESIHYSFS